MAGVAYHHGTQSLLFAGGCQFDNFDKSVVGDIDFVRVFDLEKLPLGTIIEAKPLIEHGFDHVILKRPRERAEVLTNGQRLFVIGGYDEQGQYVASAEVIKLEQTRDGLIGSEHVMVDLSGF